MNTVNTGYYFVRAMSQTREDFDVFFSNNVVAVGWSKINFTNFEDIDELIQEVNRTYYDNSDVVVTVAGRKRNEIRRFKSIQKGDKILVPYYSSVVLSYATENVMYIPELKDTLDLSNQRKVEYLRDDKGDFIRIPRSELSEGLQRRLRVPGSTMSDLSEFETEIDRLYDARYFDNYISEEHSKREEEFKERLLRKIRTGKSFLKAGGIGFENLVKELLNNEGYETSTPARNKYDGIADIDIIATRGGFVDSEMLYIQAKHHDGQTNDWGAKQLLDFVRQKSDMLSEYKLVLITTGMASKELAEVCDKNNIYLIDGDELVELIYSNMDKLSFNTKRALTVIDVPQLTD